MSEKITVDLDQATVLDWLELMGCSGKSPAETTRAYLTFVDKVVVGGVMGRPYTEIPMIVAQVSQALDEESERMNIALGSLINYLNGDK